MATVQTWLDRWVEDERSVPRRTSRFPDDVPRLWGVERPFSEGGGGVTAGGAASCGGTLARFRRHTRPRRELYGASLADVQALGGASEEGSAGCLSIRDNLPSAEYLAVPFVRRAWRLLWLLDDGGGVQFEFAPSGHLRASGPPELRAITFDWRLTRCLDMDPRTAHFNLRRLLQMLISTGFLDETDSHGLSLRSYELIRGGNVGAFYKALFLRLCNRYPWGIHDDLPPLQFVQYNALFMMWVLTRAVDQPISAAHIEQSLSALARRLALESDDITWSADSRLMTQTVQERFLQRVARMLGLCLAAPQAPGYRPTPFAGRVLRWQG